MKVFLIFILSPLYLFFGYLLASEAIVVTDSLGNHISVKLPVRRVVALTSDALETIRAIGAEDLVVGINKNIPKEPLFWPKLKGKPVVGNWMEPNYEALVQIKPDIIICYSRWGKGIEKKISPLGIKLVRLDFYKVNSLKRDVNTLSLLLGKEKEGGNFISWYQKYLNLIKERLKNIKYKPKVYIESYTPFHTDSMGSGGHEMCLLAGGNNIASSIPIPFPRVDPEWVLDKNPDIIIKAVSINGYELNNSTYLKKIREEIINRPGWENIKAIKESRIYIIASDIWAGPRAIVGIMYMAKWFHPHYFKDLNPEDIHKEYLKKFHNLKYRGIYVYP